LEFCLGAFIVIAHNVFHIVPNEVIILSLLGLISIHLRDGSWSAMGFKRPASWRMILRVAVVAAILRILLWQFLIEPITGFFWPKPSAPTLANEITGNIKMALVALLLLWTFAAFGEEIVYRGYLLTRAADIGRRSAAAYWVGIVLASILFGYGHYWCDRFRRCRINLGKGLTWSPVATCGPAFSLTDSLTRSGLSTLFWDGRSSWITQLGYDPCSTPADSPIRSSHARADEFVAE
jgi:membrane protease YdiL (CAAX protease family)